MRSAVIVAVDNDNLPQAAAVHAVTWQESHRSFCTPEFVELHSPEHQQEYMAGKMNSGSRFYMLVEDIPAGIVSVTGSMIEDLYVLPSKQNRGYGTELLQYAIKKCKDTPTLWVLANNTDAMRLYRRAGFRETGRINAITEDLSEIEFELS